MKLPKPKYKSNVSFEEALSKRRSIRSYKDEPLNLQEVSQLLWSAQGQTGAGERTAPSAGATYPIETHLVVGKVSELEPGVYEYDPEKHSIELKVAGDIRDKLAQAALAQDFILQAPINIVLSAIYQRTTGRYGERGIRYVHMEAGHIGQNVHLQCETLGLGTVMVGAFYDEQVKKVIKSKGIPLYIMPVGKKRVRE